MNFTISDNGKEKALNIYSDEGFEILAGLWVKAYAHRKLTHDITWMGIPIIQLPEDIIMMQELIWRIRPDIIIECGLAHGGSALFYASLLDLIGKGWVIGIDIEIRQYNKIAIQNHPLSHRVKLIENSSISDDTIQKIKEMTKHAGKVMVVLDSNHSKEHVYKELELYKDFVTPGSYLVAMDGAQAYVWDIPNGRPEWKNDNPLAAIEEFLKYNNDFEIDEQYTRLKVTANPKGFLKKLTQEERLTR
jgi:cephalosporin hydroxylase